MSGQQVGFSVESTEHGGCDPEAQDLRNAQTMEIANRLADGVDEQRKQQQVMDEKRVEQLSQQTQDLHLQQKKRWQDQDLEKQAADARRVVIRAKIQADAETAEAERQAIVEEMDEKKQECEAEIAQMKRDGLERIENMKLKGARDREVRTLTCSRLSCYFILKFASVFSWNISYLSIC